MDLAPIIRALSGGRCPCHPDRNRPANHVPRHTARAVRSRQVGTVYESRHAAATAEPLVLAAGLDDRAVATASRLRVTGVVRGGCPICGRPLNSDGTCTNPTCFNRIDEESL